jgi:hypothetical protein
VVDVNFSENGPAFGRNASGICARHPLVTINESCGGEIQNPAIPLS